ncbi:unnamed protein product [Rotaria sp. Silwood2]|nr:unnamed protein product [Rotaria sp. Silwood2]CAF4477611.1 unnamed protein product [Rotaria sp. Silwood2]
MGGHKQNTLALIESSITVSPSSSSSSSSRIRTVTHHEYFEPYPTVKSWLQSQINNPKQRIKNYFLSYIPFINWIYRYNLTWFWGDLVAGLTVGAIVIPQSMAYAGLAKLEPQFGLYSSFVGVMIYWLFATSKVNEIESGILILLRTKPFTTCFITQVIYILEQ